MGVKKLLFLLLLSPSLLAATGNVVSYDTLDQLLSTANPTSVSTELSFKGRTAVNDGGGGTGVFVQDSSPTNLGTIVNSQHPNGSGWQFQRQYEGALNPKWFGAKGTGTEDDTAAIQAAFAAILDTTGTNTVGHVYFPPGNYKMTDSISIPEGANDQMQVRISGDHRRSTTVTMAAERSFLTTPGRFVNFSVSFMRFTMSGVSAASSTPCFNLPVPASGVFDNLEFYGWVGNALYVSPPTDRAGYAVKFNNCWFYLGYDNYIKIDETKTYGMTQLAFDNCRFAGKAAGSTREVAAFSGKAYLLNFSNCVIEGLDRGIELLGNNATSGNFTQLRVQSCYSEVMYDAFLLIKGSNADQCGVSIEDCFLAQYNVPSLIIRSEKLDANGMRLNSFIWRNNQVAKGTGTTLMMDLSQTHSLFGPGVREVYARNTLDGNKTYWSWPAGREPDVFVTYGDPRIREFNVQLSSKTNINVYPVPAKPTVVEYSASVYAKTNNVDRVELFAMDSLGNEFPLTGYAASGNGVINVKDYGAVGDGTTDDTAAWNAAIAAAAGTTMVVLPSGSYLVNGTNIQGNSVTNAWVNLATGTPIAQQQQTVAFRSYEFDLPTIQAHTELAFDVLDPQAESGQWFRAFHPEWPYLSIVGSCTSDGIVHIKLFNSNGIIINPMVETFIVMFGKTP